MSYALETTVTVEKSRAEIERILARYGATSFAYMTNERSAVICFVAKGKMVKFLLPLPDRNEKRLWFTPTRRNHRCEQEAYREWEQACRSKWRALCLCVKAKLEAVESGITTFEAEFLAHFVAPGGGTFGEWAIPQLEEAELGNACACASSSIESWHPLKALPATLFEATTSRSSGMSSQAFGLRKAWALRENFANGRICGSAIDRALSDWRGEINP